MNMQTSKLGRRDRMKIGICCYPSYGGSGVVATELGKHLARRGHDVHFISYDKPFRLEDYQENVHFHGVDTANYPVFKHPPYIMALANKMAEVAERENLEIIHAHYAVPHATAVMLANQMVGGRLKTVTTLHGTDVTIMSEEDSLKQVMAYSVNQSDIITAVSDDLARTAEEAWPRSKPYKPFIISLTLKSIIERIIRPSGDVFIFSLRKRLLFILQISGLSNA